MRHITAACLIRKVVIPAAGFGTRLFPATKEQPKEMLPIFSKLFNGMLSVKPLLQMIFEELYGANFREFCFVVGRGKRSIEDHFTPDHEAVLALKNRAMDDQALDLNGFYTKLTTSKIIWVNQPEAKGFGDAVMMAHPFVQSERCLVHAGDTYIISQNAGHIKSLIKICERSNADAAFLVQEIENPKQYGIIEGKEIEKRVYRVEAAAEKPEKPATNLAIMPIYVFQPIVFEALQKTTPGKGGEIQLTDAIQKLIEWGLNVRAVKLGSADVRLDVGDPETYWEALKLSYKHFHGRMRTIV